MNAAHLDFAPLLQRLITPFAGHPLLERLFFGSLELAVLALLVFAAIRVGRIRSPRLAALLWLLVLGKPLVSLAVGSPFHLFRMEVPVAVVAAPAPLAPAAHTDPQPSFATSSSSSIDFQSLPEPIVAEEEMAGAPFAPLPEKATPTPAAPQVTPTAAVPTPPARTSPPWNPATWILGIWLTGVACFASLSLVDRLRIWRLVRASRKPEPSLADRYAALAGEMGLKRPASLRVTDEIEGPALAGSIFSTILIPGWLAEEGHDAKLDWALRHELMHFRLRDPWAGLIRELSQMLFFFHPVAWWAGAQWKTATEKACDRAIVADEVAARDYAEQLYRILVGIHGRRQASLRTGLFATRTQIGQRIAALLHGPRTAPHLSALAIVAVTVLTAVTLSVGGAFADRNAKRDELEKTPIVAAADKAAESRPPSVSGPPAGKPEPTLAPSEKAAPGKSPEFHGIVVTETGAPVSGALVTLRTFQDSKTVQTDADGHFSLDAPKPFSGGCLLAADASGGRQAIYEPNVDWSELVKIPAIRIVLRPTRAIPVTVNDAAGRPVSGAVVAASAYLLEIAKEASDAGGRAVLRVPADAELQSVFAVKPEVGLDYFSYLYPGQIANSPYLLPRGDARPVKFVLSGAKTARLRFVDARQRPLPGLRITPAFFQRPRKGSILNVSAPEFKQTTDANGVATFRMIPADNVGFVQFAVSTPEYAIPNESLFDPKWADREITWVLEGKQLLRGGPDAGKAGATKTAETLAEVPISKPVSARRTTPAAALPAKGDNVEVKEIHGRVLLPDGRPAAGARVLAIRRYWLAGWTRTPHAKTIAGPDGAFTIAIPQHNSYDGIGTSSKLATIAAEVDGIGTAYEQLPRENPTSHEFVIKLLPEVLIHGRIVDLEGKPVAGVHVAIDWQASPREGFDKWLESLRAGNFLRLAGGRELQGYEDSSKPPVVTDGDGRFLLRGIGVDRVVQLALRGERIADTSIDVVTRPIKTILLKEGYGQVFGRDFTYQAEPTRPVVGTVRDATTGKPLAGVRIQQLNGPVHAQTDAQGKYRLVGLPRTKARRRGRARNELLVLPGPDQPYPELSGLPIADAPGLEPITLDVKLPRGVWINGRVAKPQTEVATVLMVLYYPALSNPLVKQFPELAETRNYTGPQLTYTRLDGTFRVVGLPGPGLVAVDGGNMYFNGIDSSHVAEMAKNYPQDFQHRAGRLSAIREIDPAPGAENFNCELVVSAGGTMQISLVDQAGKPVSHVYFWYRGAAGGLTQGPTGGSPFELHGFTPNESRAVLFQSPKLAKALVIHYDEKASRSMAVTLEPWMTVKGRFVDQEGLPIKWRPVDVEAEIGPKGRLNLGGLGGGTDADGRFVFDQVAPGAKCYSFSVHGFEGPTKVVPVAGKTLDLGDIHVKPKRVTVSTFKPDVAPQSVAALAKTADADAIVVHGRVVLPDGKPAAGARVLALRRFFTVQVKRSPVAKTTAGPNGEFTLRLPKMQPADAVNAAGGLSIAAEAQGFGTQWRQWGVRDEKSAEIVLKLVPEVPLHGRIINLEGRPLGGVRVKLAWQQTINDRFEPWLQALQTEDTPFRMRRPALRMPGYDDESQPPIVTDRDGRFTVMGIGADHLVELELRGDTIAYAAIDVVAHAIRPVTFKYGPDETSQLFGADFTFQVVPTRPIVGTVRDAATGLPLVGVTIESERLAGDPSAREGVVRTVTDAEGKYRLIGMPKGKGGGRDDENVIAVVPNDDQPYFVQHRVKVPETPGLGPVTLDFKLTRGLWITGRATDKATGEPVRCTLTYAPLLSNSFAAALPEFRDARGFVRDVTRNMPRPDGTFRLLGLPGRGVVAAKTLDRSYRAGGAATEIEGMTKGSRPATFFARQVENAEALQEINPAPGSESVTCNLDFDRGGTVRLSLVDSAGKPAGPCAIRFSPAPNTTVQGRSLDSTFVLSGLAPNESRRLWIQQAQRRIGKVFLFHYDQKGASTLTVTLEPCATVKGRLLDEDGVPLKHVRLRAQASAGADHVFGVSQGQCGSDGRFELHNLPPGCDYYTIVANGVGRKPRFATVAEKVVVPAGKTIDLGEIRLKPDK